MQLKQNFDPDIPWYTPQGCVICGSNKSREGTEFGAQCVDLGVVDDFLGSIGLCFNHAREVGNLVKMVPVERLEELEASVAEREAAADVVLAEAKDREDAAARDREVIGRLLSGGSLEPAVEAPTPDFAEPAPLVDDPPKPKRTKSSQLKESGVS